VNERVILSNVGAKNGVKHRFIERILLSALVVGSLQSFILVEADFMVGLLLSFILVWVGLMVDLLLWVTVVVRGHHDHVRISRISLHDDLATNEQKLRWGLLCLRIERGAYLLEVRVAVVVVEFKHEAEPSGSAFKAH
jgi:hypothetical protein